MKKTIPSASEETKKGCLKLAAVAEELGVSDVQVANLIEGGELFAINVGTGSRNHYRVPVESLAAFKAKRNTMNLEGMK